MQASDDLMKQRQVLFLDPVLVRYASDIIHHVLGKAALQDDVGYFITGTVVTYRLGSVRRLE
jgi:hypothetical protein